MSVQDLSQADLLAAGRLATSNALADPDLVAALAPYGYDEAALQAVQATLDAYEAQMLAQQDRYGRQMEATERFSAAWKAFRDLHYTPHVTLARLVFKKEAGTQHRLGLKGRRATAFGAWVQQARLLYTTALSDTGLQTRLAARGITAAALQAARNEIQALVTLNQEQENLKGLAQQATRDRDAVRKTVQAWLGEFRQVAKVALTAQPDWLERLGILARAGSAQPAPAEPSDANL